MDKFIITIKINSTEEQVRELVEHLRVNYLPEKFKTVFNKDDLSFELSQRTFQGFNEEDIQGCAVDYGYNFLTNEEIEEVFDMMEKRFDANNGVNWLFIEFCIGEVKNA